MRAVHVVTRHREGGRREQREHEQRERPRDDEQHDDEQHAQGDAGLEALPVVHPDTPAVEIANLMIAEDIGRVCVVNRETGRVVGIIARRNLLQALASKVREELERSGGGGEAGED